MKIDSHQHFWKYNPGQYGWMDEGMAVLKRDHLPDDLTAAQSELGFDGSIAVQARQTLEESRWLLELADTHPCIQGVVGWVDLRSDAVEEQLTQFAAHPRFVGVRHVVQDEPDDQFMLRPNFMRGISKLRDFGLTYDLLIFPKHLSAAIELVGKFPEQAFVLDHIAKPPIKEGTLKPWVGPIRELATHQNVHCKISGMVTEADWSNWRPEDFQPYLETALAAFGPERLMVGSDWPVCRLAGEYTPVMNLAINFMEQNSPDNLGNFLGGNALAFYGVKA